MKYVGFALGSAAAPRLFARYGTAVFVTGIILIIAGLAGILVSDANVAPDVRPLVLAPVLLAAGVGQGFATNPVVTLVMSGVDRSDAGAAAGIYLTTGQLAGAFGLAGFGSVFLALLADDVGPVEPAAFSHALRWTAAMFAFGTISALPFVASVSRRPPARWPRMTALLPFLPCGERCAAEDGLQ